MPPSSRAPHDPFTTSSNHAAQSLRTHPSQTFLRSNASSASTRTRQQGNLFAANLSRRPTSKSTPRLEDDVLPDSESETELGMLGYRQRAHQARRTRHASPAEGRMKTKSRQHHEEHEIVNRQPDGSYLLGPGGPHVSQGLSGQPPLFPKSAEEEDEVVSNIYFSKLARDYFSTGAHIGGRSARAAEEKFEREWPEMWAHSRGQILRGLEDEAWLYERSKPGMP